MALEIVIYTFEVLLLLAIGAACYQQYVQTKEQMLPLQELLPPRDHIFLANVTAPEENLDQLEEKVIATLVSNKSRELAFSTPEQPDKQDVNFKLINTSSSNPLNAGGFTPLLNDCNAYLIKNRGQDVDFQLLQNILNRHYEASTSKVELSINLPLYTGLLGTFTGIVLGVLGLSLMRIEDTVSINTLLRNVALSMTVSGTGLLFTVLNYRRFKTVIQITEQRKNDFINFVQLGFLSHKKRDVSSAIYALQESMKRFQQDFKGNLSTFSLSMTQVEKIVVAQEKILNAFNQSKISEIIQFNRNMFDQMARSAQAVEKFDGLVANLSNSSQNFTQAIDSTIQLFNRSERIETYLKSLAEHLSLEQEVFKDVALFFHQNKQELETRQLTINQVMGMIDESIKNHLISLNDGIWKELDVLTQQIKSKITAIKALSDTDLNELQKMYASRIDAFNHFARLETIEQETSQIHDLLKRWPAQQHQENLEKKFDQLILSLSMIPNESPQNELPDYEPIPPKKNLLATLKKVLSGRKQSS